MKEVIEKDLRGKIVGLIQQGMLASVIKIQQYDHVPHMVYLGLSVLTSFAFKRQNDGREKLKGPNFPVTLKETETVTCSYHAYKIKYLKM